MFLQVRDTDWRCQLSCSHAHPCGIGLCVWRLRCTIAGEIQTPSLSKEEGYRVNFRALRTSRGMVSCPTPRDRGLDRCADLKQRVEPVAHLTATYRCHARPAFHQTCPAASLSFFFFAGAASANLHPVMCHSPTSPLSPLRGSHSISRICLSAGSVQQMDDEEELRGYVRGDLDLGSGTSVGVVFFVTNILSLLQQQPLDL
eukprot:3013120-Rhodomonas_salina.2